MKRRVFRNALLLLCLLIVGAGGYFFAYPQLRAAWLWRQAQSAIAHGDFRAAQEMLRSCLTVRSNSAETHFLLARTARRAGDFDEARTHLQEAGRREWPHDQIELEELLISAQSGDLPHAEPRLLELLAQGQAEEPLILEALVRGYLRCNFAKDALRWAGLWNERHPEDWLGRFWRGRALEAGWQLERAVEQYQAALSANPGHTETRLHLAELLLRLRRYSEALEQFHPILATEPDHAAAVVGVAACQRAAGEIDAARSTLERLLAREPTAPALALRGMLALDRNDPRQAVTFLRRADALDPYNGPTLRNLAAATRMLNDDAEARQYEQRAERIENDQKRLDQLAKDALENPADAGPRLEAGTLCMRLGKWDQALHWLAGALVLDPGHEAARTALADCLDKIGDAPLRESYHWLLAGRRPADTTASP